MAGFSLALAGRVRIWLHRDIMEEKIRRFSIIKNFMAQYGVALGEENIALLNNIMTPPNSFDYQTYAGKGELQKYLDKV